MTPTPSQAQRESIDVSGYDLPTRMRWAAEFNQWQTPADFPIALPDFGGDTDAQYKDPDWRAAVRAVNDTITHPQWSLAWWVFALNKTPQEWAEWRGNTPDTLEVVAAFETALARLGGAP